MNVDLNKCPADFCECGCPYYRQRFIIKRISGIMAGNGAADQFHTVAFMACERCAKPHSSTPIEIPRMKTKEEMEALKVEATPPTEG